MEVVGRDDQEDLIQWVEVHCPSLPSLRPLALSSSLGFVVFFPSVVDIVARVLVTCLAVRRAAFLLGLAHPNIRPTVLPHLHPFAAPIALVHLRGWVSGRPKVSCGVLDLLSSFVNVWRVRCGGRKSQREIQGIRPNHNYCDVSTLVCLSVRCLPLLDESLAPVSFPECCSGSKGWKYRGRKNRLGFGRSVEVQRDCNGGISFTEQQDKG